MPDTIELDRVVNSFDAIHGNVDANLSISVPRLRACSFDQFQKFSEEPLTVCPVRGPVQRVIQNVGVVFKGSGWYITDSRQTV